MSSNQSTGILDRLFHLSENNTTVKRECLAGLTPLYQWHTFSLSIQSSSEMPAWMLVQSLRLQLYRLL